MLMDGSDVQSIENQVDLPAFIFSSDEDDCASPAVVLETLRSVLIWFAAIASETSSALNPPHPDFDEFSRWSDSTIMSIEPLDRFARFLAMLAKTKKVKSSMLSFLKRSVSRVWKGRVIKRN
jgi:hypothetical protein